MTDKRLVTDETDLSFALFKFHTISIVYVNLPFQICHNCISDAPQTKLELLTTICEDLHVHMNHWNSLKQIIYTDVWLQMLMPSLCTQMDTVRRTLFQLRDSALWWIDRLIRVGLQVSEHCFFSSLAHM